MTIALSTLSWIGLALCAWAGLSVPVVLVVTRFLALATAPQPAPAAAPRLREPARPRAAATTRRVLVVDDDPGLRQLLTATLPSADFQVGLAESAAEARSLARRRRPDLVLLDVAMPGLDGLTFCRELKDAEDPPAVVLVTGAELLPGAAERAGADAVVRKPFSPLDLLSVVDRLTGAGSGASAWPRPAAGADQLLLYAGDLNRVLEVERAQRRLLEDAYRQTVTALASTLEARDTGTRMHSLRVTGYAFALARRHDASLTGDPSLFYGCLLHDIGKIGVPDKILLKPAPLAPLERRIMERHPVVGAEILGDVPLLDGEGLRIVRSHHERWDGRGYPDGLAGEDIPLAARIFAVADTLDAITTDRPYRSAAPWDVAVRELEAGAGTQFDPGVVQTFAGAEPELREICDELSLAA